MPGVIMSDSATKKRKATAAPLAGKASSKPSKKVKAVKSSAASEEEDVQAHILSLETAILESKKNYNNIATLIDICEQKTDGSNITAAVALCRVFCRLMVAERMIKKHGMPESEMQAVDWLKGRFKDYVSILCDLLAIESLQNTSLTLLMRLVKEETQQDGKRAEQAWRTGVFANLLQALVDEEEAEAAREEFVEKYVEEHDDVRYFTFYHIANILSRSDSTQVERQSIVANSLSILTQIEGIPDSAEQLEDWYGIAPPATGRKHLLLKLSEHHKIGQEAWLAVLRSALDKEQRKTILSQLTTRIVPWFTRIEMLMDFLTDSYNAGGASSLLALSGLFYLITQKNLDYPAFYNKLYSLLDDTLLHSKHRSRFFRLLETFMSSTHLPAAMVASFIKRLSRLALHAPPGAIVVVVPWVYNMLKKHPTCTFMIHRVPAHHYLPRVLEKMDEEGMDDPFNMNEPDPVETNAIDSSLWELKTLASHYHPNVATLARIIQEQFTKRSYELEDFLDHTYDALIEGELNRELKKAPVVEFEIPKRIITKDEGGLDALGGLLQAAIDAN
ncbi:CBF/Mak21 family-domain-containing protein [Delphinella strobiligena]|nr:CBF/Mak21 family-domain-containing protein [Delphinella strobiligena]